MTLALCGRCGDPVGKERACGCAGRGVAKGKKGKKGSLARGGSSIGVYRVGNGRRGKKRSVATDEVSVRVAAVGSIAESVADVGMRDGSTSQDIGMRVPRHIIDGEEVYGWVEEKGL